MEFRSDYVFTHIKKLVIRYVHHNSYDDVDPNKSRSLMELESKFIQMYPDLDPDPDFKNPESE